MVIKRMSYYCKTSVEIQRRMIYFVSSSSVSFIPFTHLSLSLLSTNFHSFHISVSSTLLTLVSHTKKVFVSVQRADLHYLLTLQRCCCTESYHRPQSFSTQLFLHFRTKKTLTTPDKLKT